MNCSFRPVLAFVVAIAAASVASAEVVGPAIHFRATDVVVPAPSPDVLHLSMDVYLDVPNGPIDVSAFGMLFDVAPDGAPITLVSASDPSAARPPIFPLDPSFVSFVAPAASGHDGSAIGIYTVGAQNVTLPTGEYGLFTLHVDVAPNAVGTYNLVFGTDPTFNGLVGNFGPNEFIVYPNAEGSNVVLASIKIVPEPASWVLLGTAGVAVTLVLRRVRRRVT
jgi:hypothetical protein